MTAAVLSEAMRIKALLGINDDRYSPKGVDENDLFIIASAKLNGRELISNEGRQLALPQLMPNCKIPAVCGLPIVNVSCLDFVLHETVPRRLPINVFVYVSLTGGASSRTRTWTDRMTTCPRR
ncbi:hypothetical protein LMG9964_06239 [Paraburkholderia phenoliruptrix]|uniref:Uncharacterized protein n=3 Tax=Paraburkholderia phenoliruptrix TaxID=252970 RepID=K0E035_9BURK|nr:hypothetical protein [Paraburkholderia phenoliruptrix]AFT90167.1 hypothetical protein BUPH_08255 [Paraburkholderia phenoliruptrix BR3459a]CAB4052549.1 hypothetical protein LMG9964_06239 [Paraburkholderia phenoliruptrix]